MSYYNQSDFAAMPSRFRAQMINSLSGFKSANLLGTADKEGLSNLAMVSSTVHLGADPALVGVVMRPRTVPRHSVDNILQTGVFTLNHVNADMLEAAHQCAAKYDRDVSEFSATGLTPDYHGGFHAPAVLESRIQIGLRLSELMPIKQNNTELLIGEILWLRMPSDIQAEDGFIDIEAAGTVAVSGLDSYHRSERIGRLGYPKP